MIIESRRQAKKQAEKIKQTKFSVELSADKNTVETNAETNEINTNTKVNKKSKTTIFFEKLASFVVASLLIFFVFSSGFSITPANDFAKDISLFFSHPILAMILFSFIINIFANIFFDIPWNLNDNTNDIYDEENMNDKDSILLDPIYSDIPGNIYHENDFDS